MKSPKSGKIVESTKFQSGQFEPYRVYTVSTNFLGDSLTPVSAFQRLRTTHHTICLLESTDYRGSENSFSFLCCGLLAQIVAEDRHVKIFVRDRDPVALELTALIEMPEVVDAFFRSFSLSGGVTESTVPNGFFGYIAFDAVKYFDDIELKSEYDEARKIPDLSYCLFESVIVFNHFTHELTIHRNALSPLDASRAQADNEKLFQSLSAQYYERPYFELAGEEASNLTEQEHVGIIETCKKHIVRGDVFQIVPSRRFSQRFKGDDFAVYRALRSINPSPYLFYFDYGSFRIFGSSPEAQLVVKDGRATIYPIAGTYPRSTHRSDDLELADALKNDPKENAEHVMLVDLARNDLSKHCRGVRVESYKEIQFYSHLIHLVSKVSGTCRASGSILRILGDTFPAGTLSGAPKYRAIELLDRYESGRRGYYGGSIGFLGLQGECNQAIMIRSFLSKHGTLYYQAGSGIVFDSDPEREVREVKLKLGALRRALETAQALSTSR